MNNIDKRNPFRVPENYFEDFRKDIMSRIEQEPRAKIVPLWRKIVPWTAVAAVLGGIILTTGILVNNTEPQMADADFATKQQNEAVYASSSEDEDFYLYLEDQVAKDSYYSTINF